MSINFPQEMLLRLDAIEQYLNIHQTDIDRLWKRQSPTGDWGLGSPMGSPSVPSMFTLPFNPGLPIPGEGGGGSEVTRFKTGITTDYIYKGSDGPVEIKEFNGTSDVTTGVTKPNVRSPLFDVPAGKNVMIQQDRDTSVWYITAREC